MHNGRAPKPSGPPSTSACGTLVFLRAGAGCSGGGLMIGQDPSNGCYTAGEA